MIIGQFVSICCKLLLQASIKRAEWNARQNNKGNGKFIYRIILVCWMNYVWRCFGEKEGLCGKEKSEMRTFDGDEDHPPADLVAISHYTTRSYSYLMIYYCIFEGLHGAAQRFLLTRPPRSRFIYVSSLAQQHLRYDANASKNNNKQQQHQQKKMVPIKYFHLMSHSMFV